MERLPYALLLAYDGAAFRGWQRQPGLASVQQAVEQALQLALGRELAVFGASRTDAGVHAEGQVAHFHARLPVDLAALQAALRQHLPASIALRAAAAAHRSFHARASSVGKRYRYRFCWGPRPGEPRSWWLGADARPRWERAREALQHLGALPHLAGLASPSRDRKPAPPMDAWSLDDQQRGDACEAALHVRASAFRKHQIRNLAGHLAAIALGLAEPRSLAELAALHRPWRGATAPPHGLTLVEVLYPPDLDPFRSRPGGQNGPGDGDEARAITSAATSR
jgi:tRNA pseudouridine38-40 synthase